MVSLRSPFDWRQHTEHLIPRNPPDYRVNVNCGQHAVEYTRPHLYFCPDPSRHDNVMIWKRFLHYCPFVRGIISLVSDLSHIGPVIKSYPFIVVILKSCCKTAGLPVIWDTTLLMLETLMRYIYSEYNFRYIADVICNYICWTKLVAYWFKFDWSLFLRGRVAISQMTNEVWMKWPKFCRQNFQMQFLGDILIQVHWNLLPYRRNSHESGNLT